MVTISCSGKFHAFALAEQMQKHHLFNDLFTTYASTKNTVLKKFVKRTDREHIPVDRIHTNTLVAFQIKLLPSYVHVWNNSFDKWVASRLAKTGSKIFIGWSGMSLHSIRRAKQLGMKTILERGSSHIQYQDKILQEEYKKFGINFRVHPAVVEKELAEYTEADYISIPSDFVKRSFKEYGVDERKLVVNPYGAGQFFQLTGNEEQRIKEKFVIVYLGTLSVRKGLVYLFRALQLLNIPENMFQVWFIGSVDAEIQPEIEKYKRSNWVFHGHVDHYSLKQLLVLCDVGVQCSLEEGLSMVIPQMMSCGVPVIVTPNTGAENIITDNINGCLVPVRDEKAIADKIEMLYRNMEQLSAMKAAAALAIQNGFTWNDYGTRYVGFLNSL